MPNVEAHDPNTRKSEYPKGEAVEVSTLPTCDICRYVFTVDHPERALFDGKTHAGPWANMCTPHFKDWGVGLGTGIGQRLLTPGLSE